MCEFEEGGSTYPPPRESSVPPTAPTALAAPTARPAPAAPAAFADLESDDIVRYGQVGDLLMVAVVEPLTFRSFDLLERHIRATAKDVPDGIGILYMLLHDRQPAPGIKDRSALMVRNHLSMIARVALVIESEGFAAAGQRGMIMGIARSAEATAQVVKLTKTKH